MKKQAIATIIFLLASTSVFAEKIYMGIFKTSTEYGAWITLRQAPCNPVDGNAVIYSGKIKQNGCWKIEDKKVKIEWLDKTQPNVYDLEAFALVGDSDFDGQKNNSEANGGEVKKAGKTTLNCRADAWVGDVIFERDDAGVLKKVSVSGEDLSFNEKESGINFTFNSLNISLSNLTGLFSYESTTVAQWLFKSNRRGTGKCVVVEGKKLF